jgi:transaldolase
MASVDAMLGEARRAAGLALDRVVVKLPATGDAVRVGAALRDEGVRHALTAVYTPAQALLAHEIGSVWAIPYVDRATRLGVDGLGLVESLAALLRALHSSTRVLAASLKSADQVAAAVLAGADDVTAPLAVLRDLAEHPMSQDAIAAFAATSSPGA